jgi:hypothetical protein
VRARARHLVVRSPCSLQQSDRVRIFLLCSMTTPRRQKAERQIWVKLALLARDNCCYCCYSSRVTHVQIPVVETIQIKVAFYSLVHESWDNGSFPVCGGRSNDDPYRSISLFLGKIVQYRSGTASENDHGGSVIRVLCHDDAIPGPRPAGPPKAFKFSIQWIINWFCSASIDHLKTPSL